MDLNMKSKHKPFMFPNVPICSKTVGLWTITFSLFLKRTLMEELGQVHNCNARTIKHQSKRVDRDECRHASQKSPANLPNFRRKIQVVRRCHPISLGTTCDIFQLISAAIFGFHIGLRVYEARPWILRGIKILILLTVRRQILSHSTCHRMIIKSPAIFAQDTWLAGNETDPRILGVKRHTVMIRRHNCEQLTIADQNSSEETIRKNHQTRRKLQKILKKMTHLEMIWERNVRNWAASLIVQKSQSVVHVDRKKNKLRIFPRIFLAVPFCSGWRFWSILQAWREKSEFYCVWITETGLSSKPVLAIRTLKSQ